MHKVLVVLALAAPLTLFTGAAGAKGCIKGAAVGGVAGHVVGHGIVGAAAGCAIEHHREKTKDKAASKPIQASPTPNSPNSAGTNGNANK